MPDKYYQEYGPIRRRRRTGALSEDEPAPGVQPLPDEEPAPAERRRRHSRPLPRRRAGRGLLRLLLVVLVGVGFFAALPYLVGLWSGDRVAEGVSLQGQPVAGLSRAELIAQIDARYAAFGRGPLTLTFEGRSWRPALADLGARLDSAALADELLAAGQRGGPIARMSQRWQIWRGGLDLAPRLSVDARALQRYLLAIGAEIELAPRDAALSIAEGRALPTPGQIGRQVLADETAGEVLRALTALSPQTVVLRTRTLEPRLTDAAVAAAAAAARALLSKPLVLTRGDERWTWEPTKIAELLAIESDRGSMRVQIDPERLNRAVAKLAQLADSGSSEPRLAFRAGKLAITQPGQTGWRIQQQQAAEAISRTLQLSQGELALPVEQLTPQVTEKTLASLGIGELVGEGKSSFAGSAPYRVTNIKVGAAKLDGVLIPPGGEFSFNTQIGEIDERNGFVQGYAIIGNRTQLEWGGGICQDSTTVFRAAFWAGLPITERNTHAFYISWYDQFSFANTSGPGMDAAIYTGVLDLKFVNDTGNWLLMEARADEQAQVLSVRLYGTKPNRTVSASGPEITRVTDAPSQPVYVDDATVPAGTVKQTDQARKGMDIVVYRTITTNGVRQAPETFFTRFKAWPNVFVRGTG